MLEINVNKELDFTDALSYGGEMFLIGMATVFAVLGVIFLCLVLFKVVFTNLEAKGAKVEKKVEAPVAPAPAPVSNDAEIVAVIAAAIAMAESESGNDTKFRVVSFRRK